MTNTSGSDPNFNIPFAPSNATLPSYNQTPRKKRTKISNNETGSSSSSPGAKPVVKKPDPNALKITRACSECGREFWSLKALFGHMRCHPERQWRGINPPPNHQRTAASSSLVLDISEEERNLASYLLMLSNHSSTGEVESRFECGRCNQVFGSHEALDGHIATHEHVHLTENPLPPPHEEIVHQDHKGKRVKLVSGINHRCAHRATHEHVNLAEDSLLPPPQEIVDQDHKCKSMKLVSGINHRYGHIATHEHVNLAEDPLPHPPPQEIDDPDRKSKRVKLVSGIDHRCNICSKVFSSGQALGGHMRCHWERDQEEKNQASIVIDLNVPATNFPGSSSDTLTEWALDLRLGL